MGFYSRLVLIFSFRDVVRIVDTNVYDGSICYRYPIRYRYLMWIDCWSDNFVTASVYDCKTWPGFLSTAEQGLRKSEKLLRMQITSMVVTFLGYQLKTGSGTNECTWKHLKKYLWNIFYPWITITDTILEQQIHLCGHWRALREENN